MARVSPVHGRSEKGRGTNGSRGRATDGKKQRNDVLVVEKMNRLDDVVGGFKCLIVPPPT